MLMIHQVQARNFQDGIGKYSRNLKIDDIDDSLYKVHACLVLQHNNPEIFYEFF